MNVSEAFKKCMQDMRKKTLEKNYQHKTVEERLINFKDSRRQTRDTLMLQRRNIDWNTMSPIVTPQVTKTKTAIKNSHIEAAKPAKPAKTNKRLELLQKWKQEKEKMKLEAKKHAKPVFKVCHVTNVGLSNLDEGNKGVKGKSNKKEIPKSSWAPANHTFHAPKNIKPINARITPSKPKPETSKAPEAACKPSTSSAWPRKNTMKNKENVALQPTKRVTRAQSYKPEDKPVTSRQKSTLSQDKKIAAAKKNGKIVEPQKPKVESLNKVGPRKDFKPPSTSTLKKSVGWDVSNNSDIDDVFHKDIPKSSAKKKYAKTPIKRRKSTIISVSDGSDSFTTPPKRIQLSKEYTQQNVKSTPKSGHGSPKDEQTPKDEDERITIYSDEEMTLKTPLRSASRKSRQILKSARKSLLDCADPTETKEEDSTAQMKSRTLMTMTTPLRSASKKGPNSARKSLLVCAGPQQDSPAHIKNTKSAQTPGKRRVQKEEQTPKEGVTIFSDKDMTLETPLRSASKKGPKSACNQTNKEDSPARPGKKRAQREEKTPKEDKVMTVNSPLRSASKRGRQTPKSARKSVLVCADPITSNEEDSPAYISPFVTIARGKNSARKEFHSRLSSGGTYSTPDSKNDAISSGTSPKMGAKYFARLLDQATAKIESECDRWEKYRDENELSEEAQTLIFVPIGQSRLLISKKFQQFRGLIEKCIKSEYEDEKPITCKDLHGFWDMIYMQVGDLEKRFQYLEKVKENGWEEVLPDKKRVAPAKQTRARGRPKKASAAASRMKDFIRAARNRKGQPDGDTAPDVADPPAAAPYAAPPSGPAGRPGSARRSLRVSLLCGKPPKRPSTSPCLAMMKIAQAIKSGDGVTPSKSILKTERTAASEKRMTKSVLFKDELEEEGRQAAGGDLIWFSPVTPSRRSRRLTRV